MNKETNMSAEEINRPDGLSWQHTKNENGVDMATLNRQHLINFMIYAEYLEDKGINLLKEIEELKKENERLKNHNAIRINESASAIFLQGLMERILNGEHEVIDGALRDEVVSVNHIIKIFSDIAIYKKDLGF